MINNNEFFISGADPTTPYHLHYYKITFGNTAVFLPKHRPPPPGGGV